MIRLRNAARSAALGALLLAAGCSGKIDFEITKDFSVASTGTYTTSFQSVNMQDYPDAWKHRDKIKSVDIVGVDGRVTSTNAPAATGTGRLWIRRPGGAGVLVGEATNHSLAQDATLVIVPSDAANQVINDAIRSDGLFEAYMEGSTSVPATFAVTATLRCKLTYKVP
jgi:hypothetical protein